MFISYLVSAFYGVYFISNIDTFSGVDVASQSQFLSQKVLQPPGHLVCSNTSGISKLVILGGEFIVRDAPCRV